MDILGHPLKFLVRGEQRFEHLQGFLRRSAVVCLYFQNVTNILVGCLRNAIHPQCSRTIIKTMPTTSAVK
jgi:hypothetical protein